MEKKNIFVVPKNDLEAITIIDILRDAGYMQGRDLFITSQGWGASWDGLEGGIKDALKNAPKNTTIYGVELQGSNPYGGINIDHHSYYNDDRSNELSSLEQVAKIIRHHNLTIAEKFIAANDKGFIPAMEKLNDELKIHHEEFIKTVHAVRAADRKAQGITAQQEAEAAAAIEKMQILDNLYVVQLAHSKCATVTDALWPNYENLFIICGDGEIDFYGPKAVCEQLQGQFKGWVGGGDPGFWGVNNGDPESVLEYLQQIL